MSGLSAGSDALTHVPPKDDPHRKPLDFSLIRRLWRYTAPHKRMVRWLTATVVVRCVQMPLMAWMIGSVIDGQTLNSSETSKDPPQTPLGAPLGGVFDVRV